MDELTETAAAPRIVIMAVGGAGCRIIREFAESPAAARFRLLAMDSDVDSLRQSGLPEEACIPAGKLWRGGRGCGGDFMAGQMAASNKRRILAGKLDGAEVLLVVAGMGGGFASGALSVIFGVAAKMHIVSVLLCTLPFDMEGFRRRKLAEERISADILPVADAVITLPNDLLFHTMAPEVPLAEALRNSDVQMSRSLLALAQILAGGNLFNADLSAFTAVLKRRHALCALGVGLADNGEDAPERMLSSLLASPLLGGTEAFDTADAVVFSLLGGPELSLGQAKAVLELAGRQIDAEADKQLLLGAATEPALTGKLQLTALAVRYLDAEAAPDAVPADQPVRAVSRHRHGPKSPSGVEQPSLPIFETDDKGIMENTLPVIIDGQDMDIPAYKRKGLVLDFGKQVHHE